MKSGSLGEFGWSGMGQAETIDPEEVIERLKQEWCILADNGIIPQKVPR